MVRITPLADASVLDSRARERQVSPATVKRRREQEAFRQLLGELTDDSKAFQVDLEPSDKPMTVRQRLMRTAREMGIEIAVRKHGDGFAVGLMTPARRSNRGRPRKAPAKQVADARS